MIHYYIYKDLAYTNLTTSAVPVLQTLAFEQIRKGMCDERVWYNCLLMSALGMSTAIDFVPAWGNRASRHRWNSVVINGITYPYEPFWDEDRWKYKKLYNNESTDFCLGKFRLPKVYRYTYDLQLDGPVGSGKSSMENIPDLFKYVYQKDVSNEYFETTDVTICLTKNIPKNVTYCYLCVFGERDWIPVQYGEILSDKTVTFKDMGRDIVYLPMFFQNGLLTEAYSLLYLRKNGVVENINCIDE